MSFEIVEPTTTPTDVVKEEVTDVTHDNPADSSDDALPSDNIDAGTDAGGKDTPEDGAPADEGTKDTETPEEVTYFYNGEPVEIEVPEDIASELSAKGIDAKAVVAELYKEGGDFTLSPETREKLDAAYGKFAVDAYLNALKVQNESFLQHEVASKEAAVKADTERFQAVAQEVGGEEGWTRLEEFALATLSDEELAGFNAVMKSGNAHLQAYAVRELESRRKGVHGDDKVEIIEGNAATPTDSNTPLSRQDYMRELAGLADKYRGDRQGYARASASLDARRRAGMAKGL